MASITEATSRGTRVWRVRWRRPDGGAGSWTCPDKAAAQRWCAEATLAEREGHDWVPPDRRTVAGADEPLDQAAVRWLAARMDTGEARDRTLQRYDAALTTFLKWAATRARGRPPRVADLTAEEVRAYLAFRRSERKNDNTLAVDAAVLRGLAAFLERGDLRDQMADVRAIKVRTPPPPPVPGYRWALVDRMLPYLGRPGSTGYTFGMIARYTGLRAAEVTSLRWVDFDFAARTLRLPHEITKGGRRGRVIPVAPALIEYLRAHRGEHPEGSRVVPWTARVGTMAASRALRVAVEAGELPKWMIEAPSRAHAFRRAFKTELRRRKADPQAVNMLTGHPTGIDQHYVDLSEAMVEAVGMIVEVGRA